MSHFAKVENGIVTQVIVAEQDFVDTQEGTWVQTSYNTRGGVHYAPYNVDPDSGDVLDEPYVPQPDGGVALRKNYAGIGYTYDSARDAFIPPQPYPSWVLNEDTCLWEAPVPYPTDGKRYNWNEETQQWDEIAQP
jgi:hypothetical protein